MKFRITEPTLKFPQTLSNLQFTNLHLACLNSNNGRATGKLQFDSRKQQKVVTSRSVQTGFGAHPDFCSMGTGVEAQGREAGHSPPSSADVTNEWSYTSIPPYGFIVSIRPTLPSPLQFAEVNSYILKFLRATSNLSS
jgi:hypothetical protein